MRRALSVFICILLTSFVVAYAEESPDPIQEATDSMAREEIIPPIEKLRREYEATLSALKDELKHALAQSETLTGELGRKRAEIETLKADLVRQESATKDLEKRFDDAQTEITDLATKCDKTNLDALNWKLRYHDALIKNLEFSYAAKCYQSQRYINLKNQINGIQNEIGDLEKSQKPKGELP